MTDFVSIRLSPSYTHHSTQKLDRLPKTAWTVNVKSQKHWRGKLQSGRPHSVRVMISSKGWRRTVSVLSKGVDSDLGTYSNLGRRVTLQSPGPNRMQSLSTEKACKCSMRFAEAKARRTVVLRNSSFKPTDVKGPNGCNERALTPLPGPRAETKVDICSLFYRTIARSAGNGHGNGRDIDFSVDGNDPLSSLCSGKLRTYGASSRVDMSLTPSQTLPFEAYKRLVEGFRAPISDTPEAITHDGSIVPGSTWDSIYFLPGNGKAVPPAVPSSLGTQAGFGAMSITDARSTLISHNTSGNISWSEEMHTA